MRGKHGWLHAPSYTTSVDDALDLVHCILTAKTHADDRGETGVRDRSHSVAAQKHKAGTHARPAKRLAQSSSRCWGVLDGDDPTGRRVRVCKLNREEPLWTRWIELSRVSGLDIDRDRNGLFDLWRRGSIYNP